MDVLDFQFELWPQFWLHFQILGDFLYNFLVTLFCHHISHVIKKPHQWKLIVIPSRGQCWRHDTQHNNIQPNDTQHRYWVPLCYPSFCWVSHFLLLYWVSLWWVSWCPNFVLKSFLQVIDMFAKNAIMPIGTVKFQFS